MYSMNDEVFPFYMSVTYEPICMKRFKIRSLFWSVFSYTEAEYGDLRIKSLYSLRVQENADKKKLRIWTLFTQ